MQSQIQTNLQLLSMWAKQEGVICVQPFTNFMVNNLLQMHNQHFSETSQHICVENLLGKEYHDANEQEKQFIQLYLLNRLSFIMKLETIANSIPSTFVKFENKLPQPKPDSTHDDLYDCSPSSPSTPIMNTFDDIKPEEEEEEDIQTPLYPILLQYNVLKLSLFSNLPELDSKHFLYLNPTSTKQQFESDYKNILKILHETVSFAKQNDDYTKMFATLHCISWFSSNVVDLLFELSDCCY